MSMMNLEHQKEISHYQYVKQLAACTSLGELLTILQAVHDAEDLLEKCKIEADQARKKLQDVELIAADFL